MEQFLSTLLFVLPGMLAYYWITMLGLTPSQKHNSFEMLAISVLLWIPVTIINLGLYNLIALLSRYLRDIDYLYNLNQLKELSNYFLFQLFYIIASVISSYIVARFVAGKGRTIFRDKINKVRTKLGLSQFSEHATVWDEFFLPYGPKVLEVVKLDKTGDKIIGCLRKASRPLEPERNLVLDDVEYFTELVKNNEIPIAKVFIDVKSGLLFKMFDPEAIDKAQTDKTV